jgi:hypothetical protein
MEATLRVLTNLAYLVVVVLAIPAAIIAGPIVAAVHLAVHLAPAAQRPVDHPFPDPGVR